MRQAWEMLSSLRQIDFEDSRSKREKENTNPTSEEWRLLRPDQYVHTGYREKTLSMH